MADLAQLFLDRSRAYLSEYMSKIERCLAELTGDDVWWRPNESSNSIGNLLLHLRGNVGQWIIEGVGRRAFERNRPKEFDERSPLPSQELFGRLRTTVSEADEVIRAMDPASLLVKRQIQDYDGTAFEAIYHVVEHFGTHTGQIITLSKMRTGKDLTLWKPPNAPNPPIPPRRAASAPERRLV